MKTEINYKGFRIETIRKENTIYPNQYMENSYIYDTKENLIGCNTSTNFDEIDSLKKAKIRIDIKELKQPVKV